MNRLRRGRRTPQVDPRDLSGGGRFSRFRPGRQAPPPVAETGGRGGCCLWPFMLAMVVGVAGVVKVVKGRG